MPKMLSPTGVISPYTGVHSRYTDGPDLEADFSRKYQRMSALGITPLAFYMALGGIWRTHLCDFNVEDTKLELAS